VTPCLSAAKRQPKGLGTEGNGNEGGAESWRDRMNRMNRIPAGQPRRFLRQAFSMRAELGREVLEARPCPRRRIEI
jgi:hypothetical protein